MFHPYGIYAARVIDGQAKHPNWRFGQAAVNALHDLHPDIANEIAGTELDPFHDDARADKFLSHVYYRLSQVAA